MIRVLVANLYDFDPKDDSVPKARLLEIDRWALAKYADAAEQIVKAYDDYDYPAIFQIANQLITVDLSAFYVDVTKDRMYTFGAKSEARRSGQTAMFTIVEGLARLLAPILSVTMDELWRLLPGAREESVHMALFPRELDQWKDPALIERWAQLAAVRDQVNLQLEEKRKDKTITANLSARVVIEAEGEHREALGGLQRTSCRPCSASLKWFSSPQALKASKPSVERADRNEVRPLLAVRARGEHRAGTHGSVPALRRSLGRAGEPLTCSPARKLEFIVAAVIVVLDQITKAMVRPALALHESVDSDSRVSRPDARAQHRRRIWHAERRRLSDEDGGAVVRGPDRARRRRVVRCHGAA